MSYKTFLCVVINRLTGEEITDYTLEAIDSYFAKRQAANKFEQDRKYRPAWKKIEDWYVDSVEL